MRIAISVGHHPDRQGASNGSRSEYSQMSAVAGLLVAALSVNGHKAYIIGTGHLKQKVAQINSLDVDCAVELHLNKGGGYGCETLYCPRSVKGRLLAQALHKEILGLLPLRDRGVKEGWYHMVVGGAKDYFLEHTNCPAVITEPFFIDTEVERFDTAEFALGFVSALIRGLEKFFK